MTLMTANIILTLPASSIFPILYMHFINVFIVGRYKIGKGKFNIMQFPKKKINS